MNTFQYRTCDQEHDRNVSNLQEKKDISLLPKMYTLHQEHFTYKYNIQINDKSMTNN